MKIGLLLRHLNDVTGLGKPYCSPCIPIIVTQFKFLNSNPEKLQQFGEGGGAGSYFWENFWGFKAILDVGLTVELRATGGLGFRVSSRVTEVRGFSYSLGQFPNDSP